MSATCHHHRSQHSTGDSSFTQDARSGSRTWCCWSKWVDYAGPVIDWWRDDHGDDHPPSITIWWATGDSTTIIPVEFYKIPVGGFADDSTGSPVIAIAGGAAYFVNRFNSLGQSFSNRHQDHRHQEPQLVGPPQVASPTSGTCGRRSPGEQATLAAPKTPGSWSSGGPFIGHQLRWLVDASATCPGYSLKNQGQKLLL